MDIAWSVIRIMLEMLGIVLLICVAVLSGWQIYRRK
jgi:hypothetical protein